jgi:succinate-acetate transporter protein
MSPPQVFLRPIGSPLTIGMAGLAVASLVQAGLDLGWIAASQRHSAGLMLIAVPFVLQLIACIFCYLARDGAAGAALGILSATWLAVGLSHITTPPSTRSGALGLALLATGGLLLCTAAAVALPKPLPGVVFLLNGVRFVISGVYELGGSGGFRHVAGIISCVVFALALYAVLAFELEGQRERPLLPTFRRGQGRAAVEGPAAFQVERVFNEPGARRTT